MRVGLLSTSFPRFEGDPAGDFVLGFARALAQRGHCIRVLAPEPAERLALPRFDSRIALRWLPYLRPRGLQRTFYGAGVPDNLRRDPRAALGVLPFPFAAHLAARAETRAWDAMVSHWALPSALVLGALPHRPRHLAVLHSADVFALERLPLGRVLAQRVVDGSDWLQFVSESLRERFVALLDPSRRRHAQRHSHVSPMGIEPGPAPLSAPARDVLRRQLGLGPGPLVLSLGRLVPIKGIERLIEAARVRPEVQLVVAGDGPERGRLEALAAGRGQIRFTGEVRGQRKQQLLQAADVFALPSRDLPSGRTEGAPVSVIEAMDAGLPVLASPVGGVPELVRDGREGLLVTPDGWQVALARACDPDWRAARGQQARTRARVFHWERCLARSERVLCGAPGTQDRVGEVAGAGARR